MNKEGSFKPIIITYAISILLLLLWTNIPALQQGVHKVLDPTAGALVSWNLTLGMLIIVFILALISTLVQKYATDQKTLRELKKDQKDLQEEMKKYKDHPEKLLELQKKQMEFIKDSFKLSSRPLMYTAIPFILLFRWFHDIFTADSGYTLIADPTFLGFMSWFIFYIVFTLAFSSVLRKAMKVV